MIWAVLAALGVPIWLAVGAFLAALWSRTMHKRAPGVFPCKIRKVSAGRSNGWTRKTAYARWVHDVLLVHSGLPLVQYDALPVRNLERPVTPVMGVKVGSGDPISIKATLDDGSVVEVASTASSAALLPGPFLAAHANIAQEGTR